VLWSDDHAELILSAGLCPGLHRRGAGRRSAATGRGLAPEPSRQALGKLRPLRLESAAAARRAEVEGAGGYGSGARWDGREICVGAGGRGSANVVTTDQRKSTVDTVVLCGRIQVLSSSIHVISCSPQQITF
jgi:hypothetical protein